MRLTTAYLAERAAVEPQVNKGFLGLYFYFPHIQTNKEKSVGLPITGKSTTFTGILTTQDREGKKHPRTPSISSQPDPTIPPPPCFGEWFYPVGFTLCFV